MGNLFFKLLGITSLLLCLNGLHARAESLPNRIILSHPFWIESVNVQNNRFCKRNADCGTLELNGEALYVKWDNLPMELFKQTAPYVFSLDQESAVDEKIAQNYEMFDYTLDEPYVILNPYEKTPLSAYVKFKTDKPAKIKVTVKGDNNAPDITHLFEQEETEHMLPVHGLYSNFKNKVVLQAFFNDGTTKSSTITIPVPKVPYKTFIDVSFKKDDRFYYYGSYASDVFDEHGRLRYTFHVPGNLHKYFFGDKIYGETANRIQQYDMMGRLERTYVFPSGFYSYMHGLGYKPNGNLLIFGSYEGSKAIVNGQEDPTQRDYILELDAQTGAVLNTYDLAQLLNPDRSLAVKSTQRENNKNDWSHLNGIDYDAQNEAIIVSGKHSGIAKIDEKTKQLLWWMTPHLGLEKSGRDGKGPALYDKVITIVDKNGKPYPQAVQQGYQQADGFKWPVVSHNVRYLGNGMIAVFDNAGKLYDKKLYTTPNSHASIYKIDDKKRTAQQIFLKDLEMHSDTGSVVTPILETNDILVCLSEVPYINNPDIKNTYLLRYDKNGNLVFRATVSRLRYSIHPFKFYELNNMPIQ